MINIFERRATSFKEIFTFKSFSFLKFMFQYSVLIWYVIALYKNIEKQKRFQSPKMERFCKNSQWILVVDYFRKTLHLRFLNSF